MSRKQLSILGVVLIIGLPAGRTLADEAPQGRRFRGRGPDAEFAADRDGFHFLLVNHKKITRKVTMREDGVETVTESDDPKVTKKIQEHVRAMYRRVEKTMPIRGRDPLFAEIFRNAKKIAMKFEDTKKGIRVVETSKNAYVVTLIQAHAKVVSKFVKNGHDEAHKQHPVPGKSSLRSTKETGERVCPCAKTKGKCPHCKTAKELPKGKRDVAKPNRATGGAK